MCKITYCGDGYVDLDGNDNDSDTTTDNESCDDGNNIPYDGCNELCKREIESVVCDASSTLSCSPGYDLKYSSAFQTYYCSKQELMNSTFTP
jgi:hypothetical protein